MQACKRSRSHEGSCAAERLCRIPDGSVAPERMPWPWPLLTSNRKASHFACYASSCGSLAALWAHVIRTGAWCSSPKHGVLEVVCPQYRIDLQEDSTISDACGTNIRPVRLQSMVNSEDASLRHRTIRDSVPLSSLSQEPLRVPRASKHLVEPAGSECFA